MSLREAVETIAPDSPAAEVLATWDASLANLTRAKELHRAAEDRLVEWLETNGDLPLGDGRRYYAGVSRTYKPHDNRRTLAAMLEAADGDLEQLVEFLSASPWRAGACRKALGDDEFGEHFETRIAPDLKTGKVRTRAKIADDRFTKGP